MIRGLEGHEPPSAPPLPDSRQPRWGAQWPTPCGWAPGAIPSRSPSRPRVLLGLGPSLRTNPGFPPRLVPETARLRVDDGWLDTVGLVGDRSTTVPRRVGTPRHGVPAHRQDRRRVAPRPVNRYTQHGGAPPCATCIPTWFDAAEAHVLQTRSSVNDQCCHTVRPETIPLCDSPRRLPGSTTTQDNRLYKATTTPVWLVLCPLWATPLRMPQGEDSHADCDTTARPR